MQREPSLPPPPPGPRDVPSYEEALAFWYGRINYEQRSPQPTDLKLDRMRTLLAQLGNPHECLRIVHVAGSKGKGSTSAMLAAILRHAGYRTGLFTSPHLCRVEERIQVDGRPITADELRFLLADVRRVEERARREDGSTFFEVATALGFLHFARRRVDAAVVEVGLGGRFDSTNVCRPCVAVITSISLDHTQQLGDRLAAIAMEKAGIVKPGRPAISGATAPEARAVIEAICRQRGASLRQLGRDFRYVYRPGRVGPDKETRRQGDGETGLRKEERARVVVTTERGPWPEMELGLLGEHQAANAAVAVACVEELRRQGWHVPDEAVAAGLADVDWPARLEVVCRRPLVVLDCAHNVASAQALVEALKFSFPPTRRWLVFAVSNDKDVPGIFRVLAPHFAHAFLTQYHGSARSVPPAELGEALRGVADVPFTVHSAPGAAWQAALDRAGPEDLICVAGSVFLAGELRPLLVSGA